MWNLNNQMLVAKYQDPSTIPTDVEYGEYMMRELLTLGFSARRLQLGGGSQFVISVDQLDGHVRTVLFCTVTRGSLDEVTAKRLLSLRPVYKANQYGVLTNGAIPDKVRRMLEQNQVVPLEKYRIGSEIAEILGEIDIMPAVLAQTLVRLRAEDVERQQRAAAREEQRRREEEAARQAALQAELHRKMTPMERYEAGMMLPNIKDAIAVVSLMDVVSIGGLARKMHIEQDEAKELLLQLAELGVVGPAERSKPRQVIMTQGMIEKKFQIRVRSGLR